MAHASPLKGFIAGGVGGICCVSSGHPLDTIKVRLQSMPLPQPGQPPLYTGMVDCIKKIFKTEGLRGFYKGMAAPICGVAPIFAISFAGFNFGKQLQQKTPDEQLKYHQLFMAGMMAGVCSTSIMAPGERIKCLLQVQHGEAKPKYSGPLDVVRQLYKEGGIRSIFRGTGATLARDVPASAVYFMTYEWLQHLLTPEGQSRKDLGPFRTMFAGGMAGIFNWLAAIPFDVLKTRLQIAPQGKYPNGIRSVFKELMAKEGFFALYKGTAPVLLRAFPANAACFLGYELTMKSLNYIEEQAMGI